MPLLSAGVLLWGPRRRRARAAALCAGLLPHRRRRSAQLVHRTVPRVAITVHKHNEHDDGEESDDGDDTGRRDDSGPSWRHPREEGVGGDGTGSSESTRPVLTSGDVSVLLGDGSGQTPSAKHGNNTGKAWIASTEETEVWKVTEGSPWILDGDGVWDDDKQVLWSASEQGPWSWHGDGPWSDGEADSPAQLPDCLCSAECRSVWALTLDSSSRAAPDDDSADSGAHLSPGPESPDSSGADQPCKTERRAGSEERPTGDPATRSVNHDRPADAPTASAVAARQLWRSGGAGGAELQVSATTCDLLARIATVWQADLEERHRLERRAAGDSGRSESGPSSPEPLSNDGEGRDGTVREGVDESPGTM
ncbi:hypothetical protein FJT64_026634 [Amphibalanus amphitrite]|uniref:Uncharacterized protein n=1 Tax=Amphibalanus amphitrite TaxID=1232801 RepID=A0A6A4WBE0_AMPAM|nr:hypothetical protein FJT64_026634 [Amphibalanus amphitrite]